MGATLHLIEPIDGDRQAVECEEITVSEGMVRATPLDGDRTLGVPVGNVAGIESDSVDRDVDQQPIQGGQYTEIRTTFG
ncbi:MAG: hypothetical protein ABEJ71_03945 [Halodesulfurarchaeum sp.]